MKWLLSRPSWMLGGIIFFVFLLLYFLGGLFLLFFFDYGNIFSPDPLSSIFISIFDPIQSAGGPYLVAHQEWWGPVLTELGELFLVLIIVGIGMLTGATLGLLKKPNH